ncbi:hypothetical protein C7S18_03185 [Ahniella affigens]|uniref:Fibronectin type-III domain-containing protein n=1 Tax=Ahniella affigens TaxID=2021234 RepID=A0A2P1PN23_9GAMM|nr:fibronectin type III domain-containing protein [Ahniella affigens]AVP96254.1 hypothetical protein C7S18_03185 [Ahniella affigens]
MSPVVSSKIVLALRGLWWGSLLMALAMSTAGAASLLLPGAATDASGKVAANPVIGPGVARARAVTVNLDALRGIEATVANGVPAQLDIDLFDDVALTVEIRQIAAPRAGTVEYHGAIAGRVDSSVVIVRTGDVVGMEAHLGAQFFRIQFLGSAGHEVREMAVSNLPAHTERPFGELVPPNRQRRPVAAPPAITNLAKTGEDGSAMDLLVVYTPKGRDQYGGTAGVESLIDTLVAGVNQVFANSLVNTRIRLVAKAEINYVEQGDFINQLGDIYASYSGGPLRVVYDLRDAYSADLIAYISGDNVASACGAAPLFNEAPRFAERDAVMAMVHFCTNNHTMAHEIGHLMGLFHDRNYSPTNETVSVAGVVYTDNFGYVDTTNRFTDVMAYEGDCVALGIDCVRLPYFSNRDVRVLAPFNGELAPIGDAMNSAANILSATRGAIANFRSHVDRAAAFNTTHATVSEGGTVTLTLTRVGNLALGTRVNWQTVNGAAVAGQDFVAANGTVTWAAGDSADKSIVVTTRADTLNEGNEHFSVRLTGDGAITNAEADITVTDAAADHFPVGCVMPLGFVPAAGAEAGWLVATDESAEGGCALKSQPIANGQTAAIAYTGMFAAGDIQFRRRVDSEAGWDQFRFEIDGIVQGVPCALADDRCAGSGATDATASGATDWNQPGATLRVPVTGGLHTITFRYDKDAVCCDAGADAAWVDALILPLAQNVIVAATGPGSVNATPAGIACGAQCMASLPRDTPLMLTAIPNAGAAFSGWTGCPDFHGNQCFVLIENAVSVAAAFTSVPRNITVARNGTGTGSVASSPAGIDCGQDCNELYDSGTVVTLTASPDTQSLFTSWGGVTCLGGNSMPICTFTVSFDAIATATFSTIVTVPDAPLNPVASPGNAEALISFTPPASDGGSPITQYTVTCSPGAVTVTGDASPILVSGLINGTSHTCTVSATNAVGAGPASVPTNSFIPATVPSAPSLLSAQPIDQAAQLTFSAPNSNGGAAILDYTARCTPGNATATGNALSLDVTGLSNQVAYQCSVRARNGVGLSAASNVQSVIPGSSGSSADLSISKTNGTNFIGAPGFTDYVIIVSNLGPAAVTDARVEDTVAIGTDFESATWTCAAFNGAACPASGSGSLDVRVDLPVNATVRFVLRAVPNPGSEAPVSNLASVTPPAAISDPNPNNNVATDGPDRRGVFRDGFEAPPQPP